MFAAPRGAANRAAVARRLVSPGHGLRPAPAPATTAGALSMSSVPPDPRGGALQATQLAGRVDPTARPEVGALCHQSLLMRRRTALLWKEFGRHLQLGVRKPLKGLFSVCRRSILEMSLTAMASPLPGSDSTSTSCLLQTVSASHQYRLPRLPRLLRRAMGLSPTAPAASALTSSHCSSLLCLSGVVAKAPLSGA